MKLSMKGFFILLLLLIAGWAESGGLTTEGLQPKSKGCEKQVCLESIAFNHDPNCNHCDAINIRENFTSDVHVPEWNRGISYPAAYIIRKNVTIKAVFSAKPGVKTARIWAKEKWGLLGSLEKELVYFKKDGISNPVQYKIGLPIYHEVKSCIQEWNWYYCDINGNGSSEIPIGRSRNKIYIILAEPQSPWKTKGQAEPWADVLEWSCVWADGATKPEDAAIEITKKLFKTIGALYDTREGRHRYTNGSTTEPFALTNFIDNFPKVGIVNCNDMGKALVAFSNVVGCNMSYQSVYRFGHVNCIHVIGRDWTNNPFYNHGKWLPNPIVDKDWGEREERSGFGGHAFGQIGDNIFDACLTVDIDCSPDYGPPFAEAWLIGQQWNCYKKIVIDKYPPIDYGPGEPKKHEFDIY